MRAAKAVAAGIALVALVAGAATMAVSRIHPDQVKDFLVEAASRATGRDVVVRGATELQLFPAPTLVAENVILGNVPWSVSPDMARVKRLEARVDLLPLLAGELRVSRFRLVEPHLLLERDRKGRRNWDFELAGGDGDTSDFLAAMQSQVRMVVSKIEILNGTFSYRENKVTHTVQVPELSAAGDLAGGALELAGRGQFDGRGWKLTGRVGELSKLIRNEAYNLAFVLSSPGMAISGDGVVERPLDGAGLRLGLKLEAASGRKMLEVAGYDLDLPGKVQGSAVLSDSAGELRLDNVDARTRVDGGKITLKGSVDRLLALRGINLVMGVKAKSLAAVRRLSGLDLPEAGPVDASARITNPKGRFAMDKLSARIGLRGAVLKFNGKISNLARGRGLNVGVALQAASLARLSRYLGVPLPAVGPVNATARLSRTKHGYRFSKIDATVGRSDAGGELAIYPHRKRPRVVGRIESKKLDLDQLLPVTSTRGAERIFSSEQFSLEWLKLFDAEVSIHARKLHVQEMDMERVKAGMALTEGQLLFTPRGQLGGGKLSAKLSMDVRPKRPYITLKVKGKKIGLGKVSEQIYGIKFMEGAPADVNIDIAGRGNSVREFMAELSGGVYVASGQAVIYNKRLEKLSGDVVTAVIGTVAMQNSDAETTHVRCGVVRVPVKNGVVSIERTIAMETSRAAMSADGHIDLRDEGLDLGLNLVGRNGPSLGASSLSGLVRVRGTITEPQVGADAAGFAGAAATVAGAVATGGLSLLAQGIISQFAADRSTCRTALEANTDGDAKRVAFGGASSRDAHGVESGETDRERRREPSTAIPQGESRTMEDGS